MSRVSETINRTVKANQINYSIVEKENLVISELKKQLDNLPNISEANLRDSGMNNKMLDYYINILDESVIK